MISINALRGYVLEELLAQLLKGSGYDLIVSAHQDPVMLKAGANGLQIRGRGANHQADVLGQLRSRPTFTFPLRLFVEAKHRARKVGLPEVRNAVGVINDVNEFYTATHARKRLRRHDYRYVLFSTSGFTGDARRYSLAHRVSLIDLRAPAFISLINRADRIAKQLLQVAADHNLRTFPVTQMREAFRKALGTWTLDARQPPTSFDDARQRAEHLESPPLLPVTELARIASEATESDEKLFFTFNDTPYVFVGRADDLEGDGGPETARLQARLAFGGRTPDTGEWTLVTAGARAGTQIRFAYSPAISTLLTDEPAEGSIGRRGPTRNKVAIAVDDDFLEVAYEPPAAPGRSERQIRYDHTDASLAFRPDKEDRSDVSEAVTAEWTPEAVRELLARLPYGYESVIREAARNDGFIPRERVYEIFGFSPTRMLRGFTRPPRRIAQQLVDERLLHPETEWPLFTMYDKGVRATRFGVPPEFTWLL